MSENGRKPLVPTGRPTTTLAQIEAALERARAAQAAKEAQGAASGEEEERPSGRRRKRKKPDGRVPRHVWMAQFPEAVRLEQEAIERAQKRVAERLERQKAKEPTE